MKGTLAFGASSLRFNEWRVPYSAITSAVIEASYALGFASYALKVTDGKDNFMFSLPATEENSDFPFKVEKVGYKSLGKRFWWVSIPALMIIAGVAGRVIS